VTSFSAARPAGLYRKGLRKPRGLFPAAMSSSFSSAMTEAKTGEDADVPLTSPVLFPGKL
jgi:hypothetical protein